MWNVFKNKVRCLSCGDVLIPDSDKEWTICSCGELKIMGKSFLRINGTNYENLTKLKFDDVPEHRGWDDKQNKGE